MEGLSKLFWLLAICWSSINFNLLYENALGNSPKLDSMSSTKFVPFMQISQGGGSWVVQNINISCHCFSEFSLTFFGFLLTVLRWAISTHFPFCYEYLYMWDFMYIICIIFMLITFWYSVCLFSLKCPGSWIRVKAFVLSVPKFNLCLNNKISTKRKIWHVLLCRPFIMWTKLIRWLRGVKCFTNRSCDTSTLWYSFSFIPKKC